MVSGTAAQEQVRELFDGLAQLRLLVFVARSGALNLSADPTGVASARGYGDCEWCQSIASVSVCSRLLIFSRRVSLFDCSAFLLLCNDTIRARVTLTSRDSYADDCVVGTCQ